MNEKFRTIRQFVILLTGVLTFASCSDEPQSSPELPPVTLYALTYKSLEVLELKQIQPKQEVKDLPVADVNLYFGNRVQLARPDELQFKDDSLKIVRGKELIEKYKVKWENDELFLYNEYADAWEYCGKKTTDDGFLLNTGFFIKKSVSKQRSLTAAGQEYSLKSYADVTSGEEEQGETRSVLWLSVQYFFHKPNL